MNPLFLPLLWGISSSSYNDYNRTKPNYQEEDMRQKPTVTITYDEYHAMQEELKKLREMQSKGSVYGHFYFRRYGSCDFTLEFNGMKHNKGIQELQKAVQELRIGYRDMENQLYAKQDEIDRLKSRTILERILNK